MNERNIVENAQNMAVKLSGCAEVATERFKQKHGEEARLPGNIRLMYSAAKVMTELYESIQEKDRQLDKAIAALMDEASCDTCKNGDAKKCPIKKECGKDHSLWEFDSE